MALTNSEGNKRPSVSGRKKMKNTGRTSDAGLNNMEGTMPRVVLCSHPGESSPWVGLPLDPSLQPRMSNLRGELIGSGPSVSQQVAWK